MEGRVLQDWITIRSVGTGTSGNVIQGQPFWLDASGYRDIMAWLDVREVFVSGDVTAVQATYQTAPAADEALFTTIGGPVTLVAGTVTVTQMLGAIAAVPLARWFRWMLSPATGTTGTWDATLRILVAMNRPGYRTPAYMTAPVKPQGPQGPNAPALPQQQQGPNAPMQVQVPYHPKL